MLKESENERLSYFRPMGRNAFTYSGIFLTNHILSFGCDETGSGMPRLIHDFLRSSNVVSGFWCISDIIAWVQF